MISPTRLPEIGPTPHDPDSPRHTNSGPHRHTHSFHCYADITGATTMPIRDLQMKLAETGRIRLGARQGSNGRAIKLETFRFTSPFEAQIQAIAELYGGEAKPWRHPTRGSQFEVITEAIEIPVYAPPQEIDPWYEQWGGGFCQRRCDGVFDQVNQADCTCNPDSRVCKPTVRLQVILRDVPGVGQWRLDSHGDNAVRELYGRGLWLRQAPQPIPGMLRIRPEERRYIDRDDNNKPKTLKFQVPVLDFDWLIPAQVYGGQIEAAIRQQIEAMQHPQHMIEIPEPQTAIAAGPTQGQLAAVAEWIRSIDAVTNKEDLADLWTQAGRVQFLKGSDGKPLPEIREAFERAGKRVATTGHTTPQTTTPDPTPPPGASPTGPSVPPQTGPTGPASSAQPPTTLPHTTQPTSDDAEEGQLEPDRQALGMQIMMAASAKGMNSAAIETACQQLCGRGLQEANGWELEALLKTIS